MTAPSREQVSALRWAAIAALIALFVSDYGLDVWAKAVPPYVYGILGAVAVGVDAKAFRDVLLRAMRAWADGKDPAA